MLGVGWTEMLLIGVVALIVIGPKELPALMHRVGKFAGTIRRMGQDFQMVFAPKIVGVQKGDPFALGLPDPQIACGIAAWPRGLAVQNADTRVVYGGGDFPSAICRTIIDDDELKRRQALLKNAPGGLSHMRRLVVQRHDDRKILWRHVSPYRVPAWS